MKSGGKIAKLKTLDPPFRKNFLEVTADNVARGIAAL